MSGKILALEKNTWIQAYQIRNFELGVLQKKTPWILSKHINCYYCIWQRKMTRPFLFPLSAVSILRFSLPKKKLRETQKRLA